MADNFFRTAKPGPLFLHTSANTSTILETGVRSGIPATSDADANPYMTSGGITKYPLLKANSAGADLVTDNLGGFKFALGPFCTANLGTSITATALEFAAVAGMSQVAMPSAGSIVGVSLRGNAALTAGTVRVDATVNGATVFSAINSATGVRSIYGTQAMNTDAFAAGDAIGLKVTSSAALAPTTVEWTGFVFVEI